MKTSFCGGRFAHLDEDTEIPIDSVLSPGSEVSDEPRDIGLNTMDSVEHAESSARAQQAEAMLNLIRRLERGFRVSLVDNDDIQPCVLYFDRQSAALCVRWEDAKDSAWLTFPVEKVMRLELGNSSRSLDPATCFSVIVNQRSEIIYHDFQAISAVDREILISTIMILLEHSYVGDAGHEDREPHSDHSSAILPIVGSPSLNDATSDNFECMSPRLAELMKRRDRLLEAKRALDVETPRLDPEGFENSHESIKLIPRKNSESFLDGSQGSSQQHQMAARAWCSDNVCTLALKDLTDSCNGIFPLVQAPSDPCVDTSEQVKLVEEYITGALGAPKAMYKYIAEGDVWSKKSMSNGNESKTNHRNRAWQLNAQASRLRSLRCEMSFAGALEESQKRHLQTTQSFDDIKYGKASRTAASRLFESPLLQNLVGSTNAQNEAPAEVTYYDSDPESSRPLRTRATRTSVYALSNPGGVNEGLTDEVFDRVARKSRVSSKLETEVIADIVRVMIHERMMLMHHVPGRTPGCVRFWIEAGVHLIDDTYILPKLCWCPYLETSKLTKIDLLDVCRIRNLTSRSQATILADPRTSFMIETQKDSFVMEAPSEKDREKIVYGLKLTIARLASLLMVRDMRAVEEYFTSVNNMVPGQAPSTMFTK